ncbi:Transcription factor, MADS-box [Dillenia turbinata]|uniref:Transcription factor, MADS-box n=1 Tax=Dillenia turbinata TaxID=194707 RepID=A0AAN8ZLG4_9MAGN
MEKMSKQSNLQVTFSKRRAGLFKKASELCILCGAEVSIIIFSPGKKVYSFGHPCVDTVINRLHSQNPVPIDSDSDHLVAFQRDANIRELNAQLTHVLSQLEMEKKRGDELDQTIIAKQTENWWERPVEELTVQQLMVLMAEFDGLKNEVDKEKEVQMIKAVSPMPYYAAKVGAAGGTRSYDVGESSSFNPYEHP